MQPTFGRVILLWCRHYVFFNPVSLSEHRKIIQKFLSRFLSNSNNGPTLQAPTPQHSQTHSTTTATAKEGNRQQETAEELFKCV